MPNYNICAFIPSAKRFCSIRVSKQMNTYFSEQTINLHLFDATSVLFGPIRFGSVANHWNRFWHTIRPTYQSEILHLSPCRHSGIFERSYWCKNSQALPFMHKSRNQWRQTTVRRRGSCLALVKLARCCSEAASTWMHRGLLGSSFSIELEKTLPALR